MSKLILAIGNRPHLMKIAPIVWQLKSRNDIDWKIVHTNQHYDVELDSIHYRELGIPDTHVNLNVNDSVINKIENAFYDFCIEDKPEIVIVCGDTNTTVGCAQGASRYRKCKIAHVESGERCGDDMLPEEQNRIATDHLSDYLFCSNFNSMNNLVAEGIPSSKIYLVGNIMVDTLFDILKHTENIKFFMSGQKYGLITLHRQANVDDKRSLELILKTLQIMSKKVKLFFPIHPRTLGKITEFGLQKLLDGICMCDPMSYVNFIMMLKNATFLITDSGGAQVEASILNIPCITLRDSTEHVWTVKSGTNVLVGNKMLNLIAEVVKAIGGMRKITVKDKLWDGGVASRILTILFRGTN